MANKRVIIVKICLHLLCLLPFTRLIFRYFTNDLGANPLEFITRSTGTWTLVILLVSLTVTPLRKIKSLNWTIKLRRLLGLYAFFYVCLHFTTYLWFDQFFDLTSITKDIYKRPFITIGFAAFVLLIPLAATSTKAALKLLTGKRWQQLHRLVYAAAICGVVHYYWLVKAEITQPVIYAIILAVLFSVRLSGKLFKSN